MIIIGVRHCEFGIRCLINVQDFRMIFLFFPKEIHSNRNVFDDRKK